MLEWLFQDLAIRGTNLQSCFSYCSELPFEYICDLRKWKYLSCTSAVPARFASLYHFKRHTLCSLSEQVAQLSQCDRAAGWVSYGQKSRRLELGVRDNIYDIYDIDNIYHCDVFGQQRNGNRQKRKIRAITPFQVIQGHRDRYQSKARMRLPISD